jgi:hypothetical protein
MVMEQNVRKLPAAPEIEPNEHGFGKRVETGAIQFGDDWPGLFIRGDEAFALAMDLDALFKHFEDKPVLNERGVVDVMFHLMIGRLKYLRDTIKNDVVVGGWPKIEE